MIYLLGFGKRTKKTFGSIGVYYCQKCQCIGQWCLHRSRFWFVFLAVPLIPMKNHYWAACKTCGFGHRLSKKHFLMLKPWAAMRQQYCDGELTKMQFEMYIQSFNGLMPDSNSRIEKLTFIEEHDFTFKGIDC